MGQSYFRAGLIMRRGKTARDKESGAWHRHLQNRESRRVENRRKHGKVGYGLAAPK